MAKSKTKTTIAERKKRKSKTGSETIISDNLVGEFIPKFLKENSGEYFTAKELGQIVYDAGDFTARVSGLSEEEAVAQFTRTISAYNKNYAALGVTVTAGRPHKYVWAETITEPCAEEEEVNLEKNLYPVLTEFCASRNIKTKRINEHKTSAEYANKNKWLHPDIVGYKDEACEFSKEIQKLMLNCNCNRTALYAFEVKRGMLKKEALKNAVLETISNSSWANYTYLVAEDIEEASEEELRLLCKSFKLGFIRLDKNNPPESEFMVEAVRTEADWSMINRIADVNKDFKAYVRCVSAECRRYTESEPEPKWDTCKEEK